MLKINALGVFLWLLFIPYVYSLQALNTGNNSSEHYKIRVEQTNVSLNCQLFPANNIWNTPIDTLPVDANSSTYINTIGANDYVHADFGSGLWEGGPIGIPFTTVPGTQENVNVAFDYDDESDPGPYPIPADAPIEGGSGSDGDRHVLIVDRDNCLLYELFYAFPQPDGSWTAGSGAIFDLNSNDLRPAGWTSADAAGLPILPGLVRYEEVTAGEITHAIRFTAPQTRKQYIWPARHYASNFTKSKYPPMGQRFRLKANFNISGFSTEVQVILKALKKYGMILADNGSSWFISGVPDERWDNDDLHELHNVKGSDFEAVDVSSLMIDPDSGEALSITDEQPVISLNRDQLNFGAVISGDSTDSQTFFVDNSGEGTLNWSITDDVDWLSCTPTTGTDSGMVTVSIDNSGLSLFEGIYTGTVTVIDPNASNSPQTLTVYVTVKNVSQDQPPLGSFDTPVNGSSVRSSIAVTGWALDDIEIESVKIYRNEGAQLIYIGDAIFVEGARTDIEAAFPGYPYNYKAGWGYMLLTNFLPDGGNGTFKLYAVARDPSGQEKTLGVKTITCDNANAVKPFGAIDTPGQGGVVSGSDFRNQGWVLSPQPNRIPTDGSTISIYVDGVYLGHPTYNIYRADIAALFPGYINSNGAHAYFDFDTTAYSNGVHTIHWIAEDNAGNIDGMGSRYFSIQNSGTTSVVRGQWSASGLKIPMDVFSHVWILKGYKKEKKPKKMYPDNRGNISIEIKELERLKLYIENNSSSKGDKKGLKNPKFYSGFHVVGNQLRALPIGSFLDTKRGIFYWYPGPGFIGTYELVFIARGKTGKFKKKNITIKIGTTQNFIN